MLVALRGEALRPGEGGASRGAFAGGPWACWTAAVAGAVAAMGAANGCWTWAGHGYLVRLRDAYMEVATFEARTMISQTSAPV